MTPNQARKICNILIAVTVLLAVVGSTWKLLMILCVGCLAAVCVLMLRFWRCPHCDRSLGRLSDLKYCPYCGKSIDEEDNPQ